MEIRMVKSRILKSLLIVIVCVCYEILSSIECNFMSNQVWKSR